MRINKYSLIISLIIFFQLSGFYLLDDSVIQSTDLAVFLEIILCIVVYMLDYKNNVKNTYGFLFLSVFFLVFFSSWSANVNYGQPLFMGIRAQRSWLFSMLMYFPINRLLKSKYYGIDQLLHTVDTCNIMLFVVVFVQYILGDHFIFLHIHNNVRYGEVRLYVQSIFLVISFMRYLSIGLKNTFLNIKVLFFLIAPAFTIIFITKSRMQLIVFIAAIIVILFKQKINSKKLLAIAIVSVLLGAFVTTQAGGDIISLMSGEKGTSQDTSLVRKQGRELYLRKLGTNPRNMLFGCGYPNTQWRKSNVESGIESGYLVVDNGIIGQVFVYGIIYLIWGVIFYISLLKKSLTVKSDMLLGFFLMGILGVYTLVPYLSASYIAFPIMVAICENMVYEDVKRVEYLLPNKNIKCVIRKEK